MDDRRAFRRHPVQIEGKLISPDMLHCVDVLIRDLSEEGALVSSSVPAGFPERGYLWQARTGTLFECAVQWRKNGRLFGLRFADASCRARLRALIASCAVEADDHKQRQVPYGVASARAA
jgi:hypothetical protein